MDTFIYLQKLMILCLWFGILNLPLQAIASDPKVWHQTTVTNFQNGQADSVVITNLENGELQLPHPLVKTRNDTVDNSLLRFVVYDKAGNYIKLLVENNELFAEKYDSDGQLIIDQFLVSTDTLIGIGEYYNGCFHDDGDGFAIVWSGYVRVGRDYDDFIYVQFYDSSGVPIGDNQVVNDSVMGQGSQPSSICDDDGNYRIFWDQGNWDKTAVYYQKFTGSGEKIGTNELLNPEDYFKHEYSPIAAKNSKGELVVAWSTIVDQDAISSYTDAYVRFFDSDGLPKGPPIRVDDDTGETRQWITDICFDSQDNLLLVWIDRRGIVDGNFAQIYAQLYNVDGIPLNRNRQIAPAGGVNDADIVLLPGDQFQISWEGRYMGTAAIIVNHWAMMPTRDGLFSSSVFDAGPGGADFATLNWSEMSGSDSGNIQFKLRSSETAGAITASDWYGPTSTTDFYSVADGQITNPLHNGDRYIQYQALLTTQIPGATPTLTDVSLWFTTLDSIAPLTPSGLAAQNDVHQIQLTWLANSESDLKSYKLYRRISDQDYDVIRAVEIPCTNTHYIDTNVLVGTVYHYALSAIDSNLNESLLSEDVRGVIMGRLLYVDDDAAAGGDGSYNQPFSTITTGLATADFGDTVIVLPGNYSGPVDIGVGVALVGSGADVTKVEGSPNFRWLVNCGDSSMIKGFTVIIDSEGSAIRCYEASPLITENVLINYGGDNTYGIEYSMMSTPSVLKNIISGFGMGINEPHGHLNTRPALISNNIIVGSKWLGIIIKNHLSRITNNTIVQQAGTGIYTDCYEAGLTVMNNIIHIKNDLNGEGINCGSGSAAITCSYNNIIANTTYENCEPGEGSMSAVPVFLQERPNDFRLAPGSPGIDAGNPASEFDDRDGTRNDMGAFGGPDPIEENIVIENSTSVMVSNASGFPGDSITTSISLSDMAGMRHMQFEFTYDENLLAPISVSHTSLTENFQLEWQAFPGRILVSLERSDEVIEGSGEIVTIQFIVNSASVAGDASPLGLENLQIHNGRNELFRILQVTDGAFIVHLGSTGGRYVFVDHINSGFEDGSRNAPFRTISGGIAGATGGDTVLVAAGEYNEKLEMRGNIFVKGMGALVTRVYSDEETIIFDGINQSGISGFTLESGEGAWATIACYQSSPLIYKNKIICEGGRGIGVECRDSSDPEIFNNLIQGKGDGVWIWCSASNPYIHNNTFRTGEIGLSTMECGENSGPTIEHNTFYAEQYGWNLISSIEASPQIIGNTFYCAAINGPVIEARTSPDVHIYNNIILVTGEDMGTGIQLISCQDAKIVNNTIYSNGGTAIEVTESSLLNMNNIFAGSDIEPLNPFPGPLITYSAFWDYETMITDTVPGIGNMVADPRFVNLTDHDLRLSPASPCIDAGNPAPEYNDPDGSRNNMGAYGGPNANTSEEASQQAVLSMASADAAPGNLAILPVESEFVDGVAEVKLAIMYDQSIIRLEDVKTADLTKSFALTTDFSSDDSVKLTLISPLVINSQSGSLLQVIFRVDDDADVGNTTSVHIKHASLSSDVSEAIRIKEISDGQISIINDPSSISSTTSEAMPGDFQLSQNYPNPFNSETRIRYGIPNKKTTNDLSIRIYNILGQLIRELVHGKQSPGYHTVTWNGKDDHGRYVPTGMYICVFKAGGENRIRKMLLLK